MRSLKLVVGQRTDMGMKRSVNEDSFAVPGAIDPQLLAKKGMLYIVADGMGGHKAGEMASQMATTTVMREYYSDPSPDVAQSLKRAIRVANAEIYNKAQSPGYEGMGTTLVAAVLKGNRLLVANVGDSRAYLIRGQRTRQITRDHSWVAEQVRAGILTEEEARHHEHRNIVTRSLGSRPEVEVDLFREKLRPGDAVLLCSDGLTDEVQDEEIRQIVASNDPQEAANQLIELANQRGGADNITALVVNVIDIPAKAPGLINLHELIPKFSSQGLAIKTIAIVTFVIVSFFIGRMLLSAKPPLEPEVYVGPVEYIVQPGDTPNSIAEYFGLESSQLSEIQPGKSLRIDLSHAAGYYVSGLVERAQRLDDGDYILNIINTSKSYKIVCRISERDITPNQGATPAKGDIASVFGYPLGDDTIDAVIVDVQKLGFLSSQWINWYCADTGEHVWVYGGLSENTFGGRPEYAVGTQVLMYGVWRKVQQVFQFLPEEIYIRKDDVYVKITYDQVK